MKSLLLGGTAAAGAAAWWTATSERRSARLARRLLEDARRSIQPAPLKPSPALWSDNRITLAWLGHSTVLLNFYGIRILTDPVLANRIGVSLGVGTIGPKRFVAPALKVFELPPVDVLLLSHAHMDHMDLRTLGHLPAATFTVSASSTAEVLAGTRLKQVHELRWGQRTEFCNRMGQLEVEAVEVKHWGERWPSKTPRGYNGYILRREGKTLLFGGDTAKTAAIGNLRSKGPFEVAIMPIGSYRPWIANHCTPEEALEMANRAGARYIVPVHHQTFCLSQEPMSEPIERLQCALLAEPQRLGWRQIGETFVCPLA